MSVVNKLGTNSAEKDQSNLKIATSFNARSESLQLLDQLEELVQRDPIFDLRPDHCQTLNQLIELCNEHEIGADAIEQFGKQFSIRIVESDAEFLSLQSAWNRITASPLRSFDWHYQWWREFGQDSKLQIYCLESYGEIVGIAPLFEDNWLGQSRLRFIGSGKTCTDYPDLIVTPNFRNAFFDQLSRELIENKAFDVIELEGVDNRGPSAPLADLLHSSYWSYQKPTDSCWHFEVPESWEQFYKNCSKSLKRKIRKAEKRISTGEVSILSTNDGLDFKEAFDHLVSLHQKRFESKGEPGVFADPKFHKFLFAATQILCSSERAEINVSFVESEPLSAQLYFFADSGPQFYQAGINTDRMDLEPGHLMFTYAVKKSIARGDREFDFLRGNEPYKPFWGAKPRQLTTVRFVSRKTKPTAINKTYRLARSAKHWSREKLASLLDSWNLNTRSGGVQKTKK